MARGSRRTRTADRSGRAARAGRHAADASPRGDAPAGAGGRAPGPRGRASPDKYGGEEGTPLLRAFQAAIRARVREAFEASGATWEGFVFDRQYERLGARELAGVEREWLGAGRRFDYSAVVSVREAPEKYAPLADADAAAGASARAGAGAVAGAGPQEVGSGDNVVKHPADTAGVARFIRTSERVLEMLTEGVPPDTIAIIDDSGGTLTAPIIEDFKGIICLGGTVRSHLGILAREYGIPCLMNARFEGLQEGDRVEIESSARARTAEDYQKGVPVPARIRKLGKEA